MVQSQSAHPAVEAFVDVLGALTQTAVDLDDGGSGAEEIQAKCQSLIERILAAKDDKQLDWEEARQLAVSSVRRERDFAVTRFDDFWQMIWVVIQGLREAFPGEQGAEYEVATHLKCLNQVGNSDFIDEMRAEVVAVVVLINRVIDERKHRQRAQLEELGFQLNRMRHELLAKPLN